jgi:hypothetical protein
MGFAGKWLIPPFGHGENMKEESYETRIQRYSLEDLNSVRGSIDRDLHPDRYKMVLERIVQLENEEKSRKAQASQFVDLTFNERKTGIHNIAFYPAGILFGAGFFWAEYAELRNPVLAANPLQSPTFLIAVLGYLYFLFCVYLLHAYLENITDGAYPIRPRKAVLTHLIPVYNVYWPKKWAQEIFLVLSTKDEKQKTLTKYGVMISASFLLSRMDAGLALIVAFFALAKIAGALVKEYEADNLRILSSAQQDIGRKLVLEE